MQRGEIRKWEFSETLIFCDWTYVVCNENVTKK